MNPINAKTLLLKNSALWIVAIVLFVVNSFMSDGSPGVLLMFVFAIITVFSLVSLGMTWGDAKGDARGNLPSVLATTERNDPPCD